MTNQERLALADRVRKIIQKKSPQFRILRRKEQIEKEFRREDDVRKR